MPRVKLGDIFEIKTKKGNAYLHYIYKDNELGYLVRILKGLHQTEPIFSNLAKETEMFMIFFPLNVAYKRGIVKKVAFHDSKKYGKPKYMRAKHYIGNDFIGWHIIETSNWQRTLVKKLSLEQVMLSPWGTWNDTLLINRLEENWNLKNW